MFRIVSQQTWKRGGDVELPASDSGEPLALSRDDERDKDLKTSSIFPSRLRFPCGTSSSWYKGFFQREKGAGASYMYWGFHALDTADFLADIANQYGGHYQFLTILGLWTTLVYLLVSLLCPVLPSVLVPLKRVLLLAALPVETVITSIYWSLILFAPSLILPPATPAVPGQPQPEEPNLFRIPLSMDLALHATPAVVLLIDFFGFEPPYLGWRGTYGPAVVAVLLAIGYGTWAERCGARNANLFAYPFLTENPFPVRVAIYGGATFFALLFFLALNRAKKGLMRRRKGKGVKRGTGVNGVGGQGRGRKTR